MPALSDRGRAERLTTEQAANLLKICPTSLEKARSTGLGPLATNLALADVADLAEAITGGGGWGTIEAFEAAMAARAEPAALGAAAGLSAALSPAGVAPVLDHYRERAAA